jgi:hypothetical protein
MIGDNIANHQGRSINNPVPATQHPHNRTQSSALQRLKIAQTEWRKVLNPNATPGASKVNREIMLTTVNTRANACWGDELKEKAEDTIRVLAANVNGFSLDKMGGQYDNYCRVLRAAQVDIACGHHKVKNTEHPLQYHDTTTLVEELNCICIHATQVRESVQTGWYFHFVGKKYN